MGEGENTTGEGGRQVEKTFARGGEAMRERNALILELYRQGLIRGEIAEKSCTTPFIVKNVIGEARREGVYLEKIIPRCKCGITLAAGKAKTRGMCFRCDDRRTKLGDEANARPVHFCACGVGPLPKRHHVCPKCRGAKSRAWTREWRRKAIASGMCPQCCKDMGSPILFKFSAGTAKSGKLLAIFLVETPHPNRMEGASEGYVCYQYRRID